MKKRRLLPVLFLCTGISAVAQDQTVPTFRVTTERVLIEFIAVDKEGRFVNDLSKDEITLQVDGKKQKIENLTTPDMYLVGGATPLSESTAAGSARGDSSPSSAIARTAIVLDSRVLDASNFHHSVRAIRSFIDTSLQSDHSVMIAEIDRSLKILTPFTSDRTDLLKAVDGLQPATLSNPLDISRFRSSPGPAYIDELLQQMQILQAHMRSIIHSISAVPGRKHVVFFSEGYPMNPVQEMEFEARGSVAGSLESSTRQAASRQAGIAKDPGVIRATRNLVSLANNYGIAFYTVDARGLIGVPGLGASAPSAAQNVSGEPVGVNVSNVGLQGSVPLRLFRLTSIGDVADAQNFLIALAGGTNGSAFFNSNDLGAVLHASADEQRNRYMVSFAPHLKGKGPKFRKVKVKTKRKNVRIRAQVGFYDKKAEEVAGERRLMALQRPDLFAGMPLILNLERRDGKTAAIVGIEGGRISSRRNGDKHAVEILFLGKVFKKSGQAVTKKFEVNRLFKTELDQQQAADLASQPLTGTQPLDLPHGAYKFILLVEDRIAGTLGARTAEFNVQ